MEIKWQMTESGEWTGTCQAYRAEIYYHDDPLDEPWVWAVSYVEGETPGVIAAGYSASLEVAELEAARGLNRDRRQRTG